MQAWGFKPHFVRRFGREIGECENQAFELHFDVVFDVAFPRGGGDRTDNRSHGEGGAEESPSKISVLGGASPLVVTL